MLRSRVCCPARQAAISRITAIYPIVYIDALVVKVRDGAHVVSKAAHLVVGVDTAGIKHVLGIWVQSVEGAKFCLAVLTELRNRGVRDVLIACCDGLEGLPEAIETVFAHTIVQTCVMHLSARALLKMIYTAAHELLDDVGQCFTDHEVRRRLHICIEPSHPQRIVGTDRRVQQEVTRTGLNRRHPAAVAEHRRVNAMRKLARSVSSSPASDCSSARSTSGISPRPSRLRANRSFAMSATVLHHHADFDHIAAVTGQPMEWVVAR
jgi:Transposase, Mutator family